ncbi:bromodomain-containing protein 8 isoform X3 [Genypterus blacodes]|uniref:bromodomain-containing protein 8 isoform X3 n=1 Tax=Genypterus blacodes TaxID=154954 RepID=UPI003F76120D
MASGVGKHKLLNVGPTEPWSVREKLCLASSVMRSGDQNWVSVSRAIKPFSESGRPPDWFSQKHCASQYSELLEATEAPKRKRGEKGEVVETIEDVIVRRLTTERIEELKKILRDTQEQYRHLKKEVDMIQTGHMDSKLKDLWAEVSLKKKQEEEEAEQKRKATESAFQARQALKNTPKRLPSVTVRSPLGASPTAVETPADSAAPTQPMDTGVTVSDDTSTHPAVAEGDSTGSLTNGVQTATAATALPQGHEVITEGEAEAAVKAELAEETGLVEEDLVAVSYMGDELDLETVGGIIAIIEEKVDDSVEALDAAAVEAALSLCEEAVSEGHTLPGPWETEELKASDPPPPVQDPDPMQEPQEAPVTSVSIPASLETQNQPDVKREEQIKGNCEATEVTGSDVTSSVASDDGANGSEVTEEGPAGKEAAEATVKTEAEEWNQPEPNPPCLDSEDSSVSGKESKEVKEEEAGSEGDPEEGMELKEECGEGEGPYLSEVERAASESEDGYGPPSQRYTADSLASSPASSSQLSTCGEDQEAVQAQKIWKKAIMLVWRAAANHRYASVFLQPVSDDIAPGYHSIVHRPMDLSAIKKNIESGVIRTTAEFQRDIMLMFQNAVMYNSSDHDVYHMALEMQRDVLEHVQQFLATQLIMQTSESAISAKSLRGREGSRKPGEPAEKDGGTRGRRSAMEADLKMKK